MTVAELRAAIGELPAHLLVDVSQPTEPGPDADCTILPATAVEVGRACSRAAMLSSCGVT